jgi:hypothetical protein
MLVEQVRRADEHLHVAAHHISDSCASQPISMQPDLLGREHIEVGVQAGAGISQGRAVREATRAPVQRDCAAMFRAPYFAFLPEAEVGGLDRVEISVIGAEADFVTQLPAEFGLNPGAVAGAGSIDRARQRGDRIGNVDDLVVQALLVCGQRCFGRPAAEAQRGFEAA